MCICSNPRANEHNVMTTDTGKDSLILVNIFLNPFVQVLVVLRCTVSKQPRRVVHLTIRLLLFAKSKLIFLKTQWSLYVPPRVTLKNFTFCPPSTFMCFVWI
jgi:hypothetical protein